MTMMTMMTGLITTSKARLGCQYHACCRTLPGMPRFGRKLVNQTRYTYIEQHNNNSILVILMIISNKIFYSSTSLVLPKRLLEKVGCIAEILEDLIS